MAGPSNREEEEGGRGGGGEACAPERRVARAPRGGLVVEEGRDHGHGLLLAGEDPAPDLVRRTRRDGHGGLAVLAGRRARDEILGEKDVSDAPRKLRDLMEHGQLGDPTRGVSGLLAQLAYGPRLCF